MSGGGALSFLFQRNYWFVVESLVGYEVVVIWIFGTKYEHSIEKNRKFDTIVHS